MNLLLSQNDLQLAFAHVGLYTPVILFIYAFAMRTIFRYEQTQELPVADIANQHYKHFNLGQA